MQCIVMSAPCTQGTCHFTKDNHFVCDLVQGLLLWAGQPVNNTNTNIVAQEKVMNVLL